MEVLNFNLILDHIVEVGTCRESHHTATTQANFTDKKAKGNKSQT